MFSVVLLGSCAKEGCTDPYSIGYNPEATKDDGSCSDQRRVKFILEIESFDYYYPDSVMGLLGLTPTPGTYGTIGFSMSFFNYTSNGVLVNEQITASTNQFTGEELLYIESNEVILLKNENIIIDYGVGLSQTNSASVTGKAIVGNEEIVFYDETINTTPWEREETFYWIVP